MERVRDKITTFRKRWKSAVNDTGEKLVYYSVSIIIQTQNSALANAIVRESKVMPNSILAAAKSWRARVRHVQAPVYSFWTGMTINGIEQPPFNPCDTLFQPGHFTDLFNETPTLSTFQNTPKETATPIYGISNDPQNPQAQPIQGIIDPSTQLSITTTKWIQWFTLSEMDTQLNLVRAVYKMNHNYRYSVPYKNPEEERNIMQGYVNNCVTHQHEDFKAFYLRYHLDDP
ncbi:hypothetical protein TRICI_006446 [Trichomonascus ciferrii]|uniref:Uncharacterized protein n=1 Tax=Trichomonascus ciferrii TaxID=44093 RepID=A0A642UH32_9ASCO|nr:hypothetical protein TRICI_006446 [Trichomonascus ciferrii]